MSKIHAFCTVQRGLSSGQRLAENDTFVFVFQGGSYD